MIDIDELKRLLADVTTPGEWEIAGQPWPWRIWGNKGHSAVAYTMHPNDARAIIALHNSAPALLAELEAARRVCETAERLDQEAQAGAIAYQTAVDLQAALAAWQKARKE